MPMILNMGNVVLQVSPPPAPFLLQIPLVPLSPALSIILNIYLMLKLSYMTWLRFAIWLLLGECSHGCSGEGEQGLSWHPPAALAAPLLHLWVYKAYPAPFCLRFPLGDASQGLPASPEPLCVLERFSLSPLKFRSSFKPWARTTPCSSGSPSLSQGLRVLPLLLICCRTLFFLQAAQLSPHSALACCSAELPATSMPHSAVMPAMMVPAARLCWSPCCPCPHCRPARLLRLRHLAQQGEPAGAAAPACQRPLCGVPGRQPGREGAGSAAQLPACHWAARHQH